MAPQQASIPAPSLHGACKAAAAVSNWERDYQYCEAELSGWSTTVKKKENINELLTAWSRKADSVSSLCNLFEGNEAILNAANIASMLTQLSRLSAKQQRQQHPRAADIGSAQPGELTEQFDLREARHLAEAMTRKLVALLRSQEWGGYQLLPDDMGLQETIKAASALARLG